MCSIKRTSGDIPFYNRYFVWLVLNFILNYPVILLRRIPDISCWRLYQSVTISTRRWNLNIIGVKSDYNTKSKPSFEEIKSEKVHCFSALYRRRLKAFDLNILLQWSSSLIYNCKVIWGKNNSRNRIFSSARK